MPTLAWIIAATALSGALSALCASLFLLVPDGTRVKMLPSMVSFATGALLAVALLRLLPEAIDTAGAANAEVVGAVLLGGILLFFVLEKLVLWRHCHQAVCEGHSEDHGHRDAAGSLILIGDGFHNVLDGVLIAAAFMTDIYLGIVTAIAVAAHEIPQEVGDIAILLHRGMSRRRALLLNLLTSLASAAGGVAAYYALVDVQRLLPYAIALAASSFLYVAVADLIPGLHRRTSAGDGTGQLLFISLGVAVIYLVGMAE